MYYVNKFLVKATDSVQNTEVRVISKGSQRPVVLCKQVSCQSYRLGTKHGNTCHQPRLRGETYKLYYVNKFLVRATDSVQDTEVRVISRSSD